MAGVTPRRGAPVAAAAVGLALVAWIVTLDRMQGMDAGPGTDLGEVGWFLGVWTTMMAAMMLPSAAPMLTVFARTARNGAHTAAFAAGYLLVWAAYGALAYALYRAIAALDLSFLSWDEGGRYVAGGAVLMAAVYEVTPMKAVCLRHCRSPVGFVMTRWRPGAKGALRMGAGHGLWCAGCCWALMVALFAVGVMSVLWMAIVAAIVFAEKVLPGGERTTRAVAVGLLALGLWIAFAPASVPGLTDSLSMAM